MKVSAVERLKKFYQCFDGNDRVLVMINADPDAIASAMAVKRLLWRKTVGVDICTINTIKRPDNLAMVDSLDVKLVKYDSLKKSDYSKFIIVDSQPHHNVLFGKFKYNVIIDHHPKERYEADFQDIRPDYGATASMMTEYIKSARIRPSMMLATALFLGIKTDTDSFTRHSLEADIKAFRYVFKYVNRHLAYTIQHTEIRPGYLKYFQKALEIRKIVNGRVVVHLGAVGNPDVCVMIADFFMRVNSVKWSVISGVVGKKLIVIFRSDGTRKNCGDLASNVFGKLGAAGGHKAMARAEIPLDAIDKSLDIENDKKVAKWITDRLVRKKTGN